MTAAYTLMQACNETILVAAVGLPLAIYGDWLPVLVFGLGLLLARFWGIRLPRASMTKLDKLNVSHCTETVQCSQAMKLEQKVRTFSGCSFSVCAAGPDDVGALELLHDQDYVQAHKRMHKKPAANASTEEWETALGHVDFSALLQTPGGCTAGTVRLLKCVEDGRGPSPIGYVLYELREKGSPGKRRQSYCELVNIVVGSEHRGCGAGRILLDALRADLAATAPSRSEDVRLYVAERNAGPRAWYTRLGFTPAGWQTECIGGAEVRFLRMMHAK